MQAKRDQNDRPVALGVSSTDSSTPIMLNVDPITGYVLVENITDALGVFTPKHRIDQNDVPTVYGISSVDGVTLIPIQTDSNGAVLVEYT